MPDPTPHQPTEKTRAEVSALKSFGNTHNEIADYLGICDDTLVKYYKQELAVACITANARVAKSLYNKAINQDDLQAQIFWLKTRARWRTQDAESLLESNESLKKELFELRARLDAENKKEY